MRIPLTEKERELINLIRPYTIFNGLTPTLSKNAPESVKKAYSDYIEMKKQESTSQPL